MGSVYCKCGHLRAQGNDPYHACDGGEKPRRDDHCNNLGSKGGRRESFVVSPTGGWGRAEPSSEVYESRVNSFRLTPSRRELTLEVVSRTKVHHVRYALAIQ